jgi:teichuronic acid biosynthesis glycosyltransferase TuaG
MDNPFFSVIIPCFNRLTSLCSTLESCLHQSFNSYEVILVDDCSSEDVNSVFVRYKDKFKTLKNVDFRYFRLNKNSGPSKARNFAWEKARGEYVAFLDSDDLWHPEKLSICAFFVEKHKPQCLYHNYSYELNDMEQCSIVHNRFKICWKNTFHGLLRNYSVTPSFVILKSISERFNESMRFNEDHDLWLRLSFKYHILAVDGPPLTILGRQFSSLGGLSENMLKMRLGEMKMYTNICREQILLLPILPILIIFSSLKYMYARFKNLIT